MFFSSLKPHVNVSIFSVNSFLFGQENIGFIMKKPWVRSKAQNPV